MRQCCEDTLAHDGKRHIGPSFCTWSPLALRCDVLQRGQKARGMKRGSDNVVRERQD